jgi:hypothetical protein
MFHRWAALGLVLVLWAMMPKNAAGQGTTKAPRGPGAGAIGIPYPNPSNPEFRLPFTVGDSTCTDVGLQHEVTLEVKNFLGQTVAVPVLLMSAGNSPISVSADGNTPIAKIHLGCGSYTGYWGGKILGSTKDAASGTYLVVLTVDGKVKPPARIYLRK